jgi:PAS domain S-box-containing protein
LPSGPETGVRWSAGEDGKWDYFSQGWLDFTGRTRGQELDDGWLEGVHPEDIVMFLPVYLDAFRRRVPFEVKLRLLRHDGAWQPIQVHGSPSFDAAGTFLGFAGYCAVSDGCRAPVLPSSGKGMG